MPVQSQRTRVHIVSGSSLFRRISTNDPLNELLLYSSGLSWGKNIGDGREEKKRARWGSKEPNKKGTMDFSVRHTAAREVKNVQFSD